VPEARENFTIQDVLDIKQKHLDGINKLELNIVLKKEMIVKFDKIIAESDFKTMPNKEEFFKKYDLK